MKIRNGFVSNSSSSSFIVGFPKKLEDTDLHQELFDGKEVVDYWSDDEIIVSKCLNYLKETAKYIPKDELDKYIDKRNVWGISITDVQREHLQTHCEHVYRFEFSDNDSIVGSYMEHEFEFPYYFIRISNH